MIAIYQPLYMPAQPRPCLPTANDQKYDRAEWREFHLRGARASKHFDVSPMDI
jgi:hypothetical protein